MTSKIKVDNINKVSDDSNIIKKCGTTTTIGSGASNPIVVDGSAVTLGRCGGTVALASGATQTGFGRTGTVDWQTGSIKTSTFTAANGEGYFCNTGGGAFTVNLPAGVAGNIVSVQDYNNTFDTNALTLTPNGSEKINGGTGNLVLSAEGQGLTLVYIDSTVGWRSVQENEFESPASSFLTATGGTITCCGDYKIHTFTGPGTFTVTAVGAGTAASPNIADYLVIGSGGGGGGTLGAGAGAGGYREAKAAASPTHSAPPYTASPVAATTGITLAAGPYTITVGAGGAGVPAPGNAPGTIGNVSTFSTITSAGGGFGAGGAPPQAVGPGGSGGGAGGYGNPATGGTGNNPSVSPAQGTNGGNSSGPGGPPYGSAGGGGIGCEGSNIPGSGQAGSQGGPGVATSITGSSVTRGGGGSGSPYGSATDVVASAGGGGGKGANPASPNLPEMNGTANTGGGGGGTGESPKTIAGGTGGSGIVVIRYKYQ
jgi:hypothetical protein